MITVGSLFSGIGGLELGLERAGLGPVVWQAERDHDARRVLARWYPNAKRFGDVAEVTSESAARVDLVCGGFPCQDLSSANTRSRKRLAGDRSGLWREFARVVGELRPEWAIVENVGSVWRDWLPTVRADLAQLGYATVPMALSTAELGAPHHRDRVFVLAHADSYSQCVRAVDATLACVREAPGRLGGGCPGSV